MKKFYLVFLVLLILSQIGLSQVILDSETGKYTERKTLEFPNLTKDQLFDLALEWVALNYTSAQDVIQYSNKEKGKIICKGVFSTNLFFKSGWLTHTLTLDFKKGRVRYTFSDLSYYSSGSGNMKYESKSLWANPRKKILKETNENFESSSTSLKKYLSSINDEDW